MSGITNQGLTIPIFVKRYRAKRWPLSGLMLCAIFSASMYGQKPASPISAPEIESSAKHTFEFAGKSRSYSFFIPNVDAVKASKSLFEANGFDVKLTVIPDHDHNYYSISDQVNAQAWEFLKKAQLTTGK